MGQSHSVSSAQTSVSTTTVTDSFNQAFSRVENLSDVGNVSINVPSGSSSLTPVFLIIAALVAGLIFIMKKK